jgi:hypothetical protein
MPVPLGAQRGSRLELTMTGTNLAGPTGLWTSFPARVTIPTDHDNGKDNGRLRVVLEIPHDAPLGFQAIRLATQRGLSNLRLFCIDDLPQIMETTGNRSRMTPQTVPIPCVVVGHADAETNGYFRLHVEAGQRVSFEVLGRRLGSPFDPQLTLYELRTGKELPGGYNNDAPGLQTDARLTYTFKEAGDYLLEVRDVTYRGGGDFWYRLRIGDFPCATTPLPMAARRGGQVTVHFAGPNVDGVAPVEVFVPRDPALRAVWVAPRGANGLYGWPVPLGLSDHEEMLEQEPNNDAAHANRLPVPGGVTGRFLERGDVDTYVFTARKGQSYRIQANTQDFNSPTEVYMIVQDSKGNQLAASNPMTAPQVDFMAPADGEFFLRVEHLLYWNGPSETYHITIVPQEPDFALALGLDRFDVPAGTVHPIPVQAARQGYGGPIEVSIVGAADVRGQVTIPEGQPSATLFLRARFNAPLGPHLVVIRGSGTINGQTVVRHAGVQAAVSAELAGLPYPPRNLLNEVGIAITEKPPFTLAVRPARLEGVRGVAAPVTIVATRAPGFNGEIALTPVGLPPNVAPAVANFAKDQTEVKGQLTPAANAPLGQFTISVTGKANFQNREFDVTAPPVTLQLVLPLALRLEPPLIELTPGGKAKVKVTATRQGGYQGPITVELGNLPAHVTASKATLAANQSATEVEIAAAFNAVAAEKPDVRATGTATAAANQQAVSPNIALRIRKK